MTHMKLSRHIPLIVVLLICVAAYAHAYILVQAKSFEFYDRGGVVGINLTEDNTLRVRLNSFEIAQRENFCELK